ncbi:MAG TPA: hypothetical protein DCY14_01135, partial [Anaerolineae bacterium]|nr:hypothetical protein [Anaerolineae bacterium]
MARSGQNVSTAHWMISCGVFVSNSSESCRISSTDNMPALYRHVIPVMYNPVMNSDVAARLLQINHEFYNRFGDSFSATRQRLQPGAKKVLSLIQADESVVDLGCGNGLFLRELLRRGHKAALLGVDFSLPLLREADSIPGVDFWEMDLVALSSQTHQLNMASGRWAAVTMFATLHHIPSREIRLGILKGVEKLLKPGGRFYLSNWQFLNSDKLKARIQPWDRVGLSNEDVEKGDFLLDWRSGGTGLRYAHQFSEEELLGLAEQVQM